MMEFLAGTSIILWLQQYSPALDWPFKIITLFQVDVGLVTRLVRYLTGVAGLLAIYIGLKIGFSELEPPWLFRFIRYGLVGLWTVGGRTVVL